MAQPTPNPAPIASTHTLRTKKLALARATPAGYLFTSITDVSADMPLSVPEGTSTVAVYPSAPIPQAQIPRLSTVDPLSKRKQVIIPLRPQHPTKASRSTRYGVYNACFPQYDTTDAELDPSEVALVTSVTSANSDCVPLDAALTVTDDGLPNWTDVACLITKYLPPTDQTDNTPLDHAVLAEVGIDVNALFQTPSVATETPAPTPSTERSLADSSRLLLELEALQNKRLTSDKPETASVEERIKAAELQAHLVRALPLSSPLALTDLATLRRAMEQLPLTEPAYKGVLRPQQCFAYPSNARLSKDFPPNATEVDT
ncbi:hypothetical protein IWQ60_002959 [Tieghemiomyces parasiticus]|uniref:Uncharacterized protein n=1 Tax=Tieghemiomyces parasiticus TaxID=78921 RepID=A0A9W8AAF9_9FUNG|nr:hypothetical protein IWQ60_002959 [Tieghemiomyces parasiticus]